MIKLENVSKEFITAKKYPGFKGAVKGLFSNEKETKKAIYHLKLKMVKWWGI